MKPAQHYQAVYLSLIAITLLVFSQVLNFDFINIDTPNYITLNPQVVRGLSWEGIYWAFTDFYMANWHPITWISHMLDVELFGISPGAHHGVNLVIHLLNVMLVFYLFDRMTRQFWPSALIAALFAIHPTHVESVVWVAERKDVLSTLFFLLAIYSYIRFTEERTHFRYYILLLFVALGLMAKPMLVTLPFVLLLLDYWPLNRLGLQNQGLSGYMRKLPRLCVEKIPLFILSALSCWITFVAQARGGAMVGGSHLDLVERVSNAAISYLGYARKIVVPSELANFYPHPGEWPTEDVVISLLILLLVSLLTLFWSKKYPYLFVGWAFFIGTLVPVIGLIQVGGQASADRYTYIPAIGIYVCLVYGLRDLFSHLDLRRSILAYGGTTLLVFYAAISWQYAGHWRNSVSIWSHTLAVVDKQYPVVLGIEAGEVDRSKRPMGLKAPYFLMATALMGERSLAAALIHFKEALYMDPASASTYFHMGMVLADLGERKGALEAFDRVTKLAPYSLDAKQKMDAAKEKLERRFAN